MDLMNRMIPAFCVLAVSCLAAAPAVSAGPAEDEAAIREVQKRQAEAWNRHDAKAYASLFAQDGDVVNVLGWWWKGRAEIERKLTDAFAYVFKESTLTVTDVNVRFLAPDVAVAHVTWSMVGARTPAGMPEPRQGIQLQVLQRQAGKWVIASFQNTHSVPEMPFPTAPASHPAGSNR